MEGQFSCTNESWYSEYINTLNQLQLISYSVKESAPASNIILVTEFVAMFQYSGASDGFKSSRRYTGLGWISIKLVAKNHV